MTNNNDASTTTKITPNLDSCADFKNETQSSNSVNSSVNDPKIVILPHRPSQTGNDKQNIPQTKHVLSSDENANKKQETITNSTKTNQAQQQTSIVNEKLKELQESKEFLDTKNSISESRIDNKPKCSSLVPSSPSSSISSSSSLLVNKHGTRRLSSSSIFRSNSNIYYQKHQQQMQKPNSQVQQVQQVFQKKFQKQDSHQQTNGLQKQQNRRWSTAIVDDSFWLSSLSSSSSSSLSFHTPNHQHHHQHPHHPHFHHRHHQHQMLHIKRPMSQSSNSLSIDGNNNNAANRFPPTSSSSSSAVAVAAATSDSAVVGQSSCETLRDEIVTFNRALVAARDANLTLLKVSPLSPLWCL